MLDFGWGEILVIAIVLILVVGPKDLPRVLRGFGRTMSKVRAMAGEFRSQFDEALKEAELDEVRKTVSDARKLNPTKDLRDAMNPLRKAGEELKGDLDRTMRPKTAEKSPEAPAAVSTDAESSKGPAGATAAAAPSAAAVSKVTGSPARSNTTNGASHAAPAGTVSRKPLPEVKQTASATAGEPSPAGKPQKSGAQAKPIAKPTATGTNAAAEKSKPATTKKTPAKTLAKAVAKPAGGKTGAAKARATKAGDE